MACQAGDNRSDKVGQDVFAAGISDQRAIVACRQVLIWPCYIHEDPASRRAGRADQFVYNDIDMERAKAYASRVFERGMVINDHDYVGVRATTCQFDSQRMRP